MQDIGVRSRLLKKALVKANLNHDTKVLFFVCPLLVAFALYLDDSYKSVVRKQTGCKIGRFKIGVERFGASAKVAFRVAFVDCEY